MLLIACIALNAAMVGYMFARKGGKLAALALCILLAVLLGIADHVGTGQNLQRDRPAPRSKG